jgi:hypothetical protein
MMFVVTLVHSPEMCLAREEFHAEFIAWYDGMKDRAKKHDILIHGAYVCPNEHTFYFVLESGDAKNIAAFFDGIMLTNHTGRISPVITLTEAAELDKP